MFVPFLSTTSSFSPNLQRRLYRRKGDGGGGGGGHGGGHGGGRGGSSSGSKGGGSRSGGSSSSGGISFSAVSPSGKVFSASSLSNGGIAKSTILSGEFSGREIGGGSRAQVYGSSVYGSGYPGLTTRGVSNRGFPFLFYPIVYPVPYHGSSSSAYLYNENEYGKVDNSSRPGGALHQLSLAGFNYTIRITSDKFTIEALSVDLSPCTLSPGLNVSSPLVLNSSTYEHPKPEEALQYYRASSVVLSLDSFNNTIAFSSNDSSMLYASIPSGVNSTFIECANRTIGDKVLLPNGSVTANVSHPLVMLLFSFIVLYHALF